MPPTIRVGFTIGQLHRGGAETQLSLLVDGMAQLPDIEPVVFSLSRVVEPHGPAMLERGIEVYAFEHRGVAGMLRPFRLRAALKATRIDVLHAFLLGPSVQSALTCLGLRSPRLIAANRTGALLRPWTRHRLESWALQRAVAVTVNSNDCGRFTHEYYRVREDRIHYIPNGVVPLHGRLPERAEARGAASLPADGPIVLGVFRLSEEKDLPTFLATGETVLEARPDAWLAIAGDGPLSAELRRRVAASPHRERILVLGPRDDVPTLLAAADLLLTTSRLEGMPNGVLEAMSAGLPVVGTRVGGIPDLIEQGRTGWLCEPGDVDTLAARCLGLLADETERRELGRQALERIERDFSVDTMVQAYAALYRGVLGRER